MNRDRMTALRDVVARLHPYPHDKRHWLQGTGRAPKDLHAFWGIDNALFHMGETLKTYLRDDAPVDAPPCGLAACIAGAAVMLFGKPEDVPHGRGTMEVAAHLLDLTQAQKKALFDPSCFTNWYSLSSVTPEQAAKAIEHALIDHRETGTFNSSIWNHVA